MSVCLAAACCPSGALADDSKSFQVGGLLFGDVYHIASHHSDEGDGATGAVLRRGYLTANFDLNENWYGRARLELNQSGAFETYDFELDVKDLYLARRIGRHRVVFGLSAPPAFDLIESIWGLRYLARTPMDLQGIASRDTGIAFAGPLNASGTFAYRAMAGSGSEFGAESYDASKLMAALSWRPSANWTVDLYTDYEDFDGSTDRSTAQLFASYEGDDTRWGLQYSNQDRQDDPPLELASAFIVRALNDKTSIIGRVDRIIEPSPKGDNISYIPFDPSAPATFFIGAVEFVINSHFRLTPNVLWTTYDENDAGETPRDDLHLRLTFFLDFE